MTFLLSLALALGSQSAPPYVEPPDTRTAAMVRRIATEDAWPASFTVLGSKAADSFRKLQGLKGGWRDPKEVISFPDGGKEWVFEWSGEEDRRRMTWLVDASGTIHRIIAEGMQTVETDTPMPGFSTEPRRYTGVLPVGMTVAEIVRLLSGEDTFEGAFQKLKFVTQPDSAQGFFENLFEKRRSAGDVNTKLFGYPDEFEVRMPLKVGHVRLTGLSAISPIFVAVSSFDPDKAEYRVSSVWNPRFEWWTPYIKRIDLSLKPE